MSTTIAVASAKGGAGKTTTAVTLAHLLALEAGKGAVLVDLDPQAGASTWAGAFDGSDDPLSLADVVDGAALVDAARSFASFDVIAADDRLARLGEMLEGRGDLNPRSWLGRILNRSPWPVQVLDCPPGFGFLPASALLAADVVVVPTELTPLAVAGVGETLTRCRQAEDATGRALRVFVVPTRVDQRRVLDRSALELLEQIETVRVTTPVRAAIAAAEAPDARETILEYRPAAAVAADYRAALAPVLASIDWS